MQVAEILSDLTSLRVCVRLFHCYNHSIVHSSTNKHQQDHNDALTLVTVNERLPSQLLHPGSQTDSGSGSGATSEQKQERQGDDDLQRAKELVDLHHELKARHVDGTVDEDLARAREGVDRVLNELDVASWGV